MLLQKIAPITPVFSLMLLMAIGCAATNGSGPQTIKVNLTGDQEVPPVKSAGSGTGTFVISPDKSISGSVKTTGIDGTVAHIHDSVPGQMCGAKNGPAFLPLTKGPDNTWSVPPGAKLTDAQYASYKAGNFYVNVHTAANKSGEICAKLAPPK